MSAKYLLDTSALYPLVLRLREKLIEYLDVFSILDLTFYEVGNVIWKEYKRGKIRNLIAVANLFQEILNSMQKIEVDSGVSEILKIAIKEGLTFYDASYLYVARSRGLKLVTEDSDLLRFQESISVEELLKELRDTHH